MTDNYDIDDYGDDEPRPAWCAMCQCVREVFAEIPVAGTLHPLPVCMECWRQTPMQTRAAIIAAYPLIVRSNDTAGVVAAALRLAHLNAEEDDDEW